MGTDCLLLPDQVEASGERPDALLMAATPGFEEHVLEGIAKVFPGVPVFGGSAAHDLNVNGESAGSNTLFVVGSEAVLHGHGVLLTAMFTSVHVAVSLASLHRPTEHRMLVTKLGAGGDPRVIEELDHRVSAANIAWKATRLSW